MKKVNYLIVAAGLFICGVMIYLLISGVSLRERTMIKWSSVDSPTHAAESIANFIFPILGQYDLVFLDNDTDFAKAFFPAFVERAVYNSAKAKIVSFGEIVPEPPSTKKFTLRILNLDVINLKFLCNRGDRIGCVGLKAEKNFSNKSRDPGKIWISMYRLGESEAVLYYRSRN